MTQEELINEINSRKPDFLMKAKRKDTWICPGCGNGSGVNGTGINYHENRYHCHKCDLCEDVVGLYMKYRGITDFSEGLKEAAKYYRVAYDSDVSTAHEQISMAEDRKRADMSAFYEECHSRLSETDYFTKRGLSKEVCDKFNLGYAPAWKAQNVKANITPSPRAIVPINELCYFARDTRDNVPDFARTYTKQRVNLNSGKACWVFNKESLENATQPIFVVEGEIDALSVIEAGGEAVSIGGIGGISEFSTMLNSCKPVQPLIIALDNDPAGKTASPRLEAELEKRGISYIRYNPYDKYKDANEILVADREKFTSNISAVRNFEEFCKALESDAQREYRSTSASESMKRMIAKVRNGEFPEPISTGFHSLDERLGGGFMPQIYVIAAGSSLGKTSLATQFTDYIARSGHDVLYYALEMEESNMIAKSISRLTAEQCISKRRPISEARVVGDILSYSKWTDFSDDVRAQIDEACEEYASYAGRIHIFDKTKGRTLKTVTDAIEKHIELTGRVPVVFIDYVQFIDPESPSDGAKQTIDNVFKQLVSINGKYKTPLILISSINRVSYSKKVGMDSLKESGMIEYSADVVIGLDYVGIEKEKFNLDEAKRKFPREVQLSILKGRFSSLGDPVQLDFYSAYSYFTEAAAKHSGKKPKPAYAAEIPYPEVDDENVPLPF